MARRNQVEHRIQRLLPAVLGLLAGLAIGAGLQRTDTVVNQADARPPGGSSHERRGLINPADQRREIIRHLESVNKRLEKLTRTLTDGALEVRVVEMPDAPPAD